MEPVLKFGFAFVQGDQLLGMRIWQRVEQDTVDHGEESSICPDGERQREDGDRREAWGFCQHANRVTKILEQFAHDPSSVPASELR
jgi:hypothetical protein